MCQCVHLSTVHVCPREEGHPAPHLKQPVKLLSSGPPPRCIITTAARHFQEEILNQARHNRVIIRTIYHLPELICRLRVKKEEKNVLLLAQVWHIRIFLCLQTKMKVAIARSCLLNKMVFFAG